MGHKTRTTELRLAITLVLTSTLTGGSAVALANCPHEGKPRADASACSSTPLDPQSSAHADLLARLDKLIERSSRRELPDTRFDPMIDRYAQKAGLEPRLVKSVIQVESGFSANAVSRKGATGLMQLMPGTAKAWGTFDSFDPEQNIRGGTRYLSHLMQMFDGSHSLALAAYNAGENAVIRHRGIPPYPETRNYVKSVLSFFHGSTRSDGQDL